MYIIIYFLKLLFEKRTRTPFYKSKSLINRQVTQGTITLERPPWTELLSFEMESNTKRLPEHFLCFFLMWVVDLISFQV